MLAYGGNPTETTDDRPTTIERFLAVADSARQLGLWPKQGRAYADIAACLPLIGRYPHALGLLDATCKERAPGSYQLDELQAVILLRTGDEIEPVTRRIGQLILSYTNDQVSRIEPVAPKWGARSGGAETTLRYHRLEDSRWPGWAVWEWGGAGDLYLIAFGRGAWERAARAALGADPSLDDDSWFVEAYADCRGPQAQLRLMLNLARVQDRIGEVASDMPGRVIRSLEMEGYRRTLWTLGRVDRATTCYSARLADHEYEFRSISDPTEFRPAHLALVPPQADRFAIARVGLGRWLPKVVRGYVAARSPRTQASMSLWWERYQSQTGVDAQRDLLDQLGSVAVFHTYPPHPLGLPFLCTMLFEIRGDPARVRHALDGLLAGPEPAASQPTTNPARRPVFFEAKRTADGIWYWQAGMFVVLGMAVHENWVVVSFSPEAVRENLAYLRNAEDHAVTSQPTGATNNHNIREGDVEPQSLTAEHGKIAEE